MGNNDMEETLLYLNQICEHLGQHRAALLVGSGFSRNADKVDESVSDPPVWDGLAEAFINKLSSSGENLERLQKLSPLELAERVEVLFGRSELDKLLLEIIPDHDYLPTKLHRSLLSLPWEDIFTTNYDTLLERANETITEWASQSSQNGYQASAYRVILTKEDLIGSAGNPRIVKLHGSFPSTRPFIITAEDYRTYPQKFAPFVNTVQQSLLENTLCMIGFSGNDPNFKSWIGWIRDNLGRENTPKIYLLQHESISAVERTVLENQNIIPINLSAVFNGGSPAAIYAETIKYIEKKMKSEDFGVWKLDYSFHDKSNQPISIVEAKNILETIRRSYPGYVTIPWNDLYALRKKVVFPAREILFRLVADIEKNPDNISEGEVLFLYEYDWIREKALLPMFDGDPDLYRKILDRHRGNYPQETLSILLSLLRDCRINGEWENWSNVNHVINTKSQFLDSEQCQELRWEHCLRDMAMYKFKELSHKLARWNAKPEMSVWVLRKAGLLAECGEPTRALELLTAGIVDIRKKLSHSHGLSFRLLSLESSMMELRNRLEMSVRLGKKLHHKVDKTDGPDADNSLIPETQRKHEEYYEAENKGNEDSDEDCRKPDDYRRKLHSHYGVSWDEQNRSFSAELNRESKSLWIGIDKRGNRPYAEQNFGFTYDEYCVSAYAFLRFREETGIPFFIYNVYFDRDLACKAAERLSRYYPEGSVLTVVRGDFYKAIKSVLTRGVLSGWTREDADAVSKVYVEALGQSETLLNKDEEIIRTRFVRQVADVLPVALAELCRKCSVEVLDQMLDLLKRLYGSEKKGCYQEIRSLTRNLIAAYPSERREDLILRLLEFPVVDNLRSNYNYIYYPEPLSFVPISEATFSNSAQPLPQIEYMLTHCARGSSNLLTKLCYCLEHGLLTGNQKQYLSKLLWDNNVLHTPRGWLRTICFRLPAPEGIDLLDYLAKELILNVEGYLGNGKRVENDINILNEINAVALTRLDAFSPQQITTILSAFAPRMESQRKTLSMNIMGMDNLTKTYLFSLLHCLWLVTAARTSWNPTEIDQQNMRKILETCKNARVYHFGLHSFWGDILKLSDGGGNNLEAYICHPDKFVSEWGYRVLAIAIRHPDYVLLSDEDIQSGLNAVVQQIQWRAPSQLSLALQVADVAAVYHPQMLSSNLMQAIMTGLTYLAQETQVKLDDSNEIAGTKIESRKYSAHLIRSIQKNNPYDEYADVFTLWNNIVSCSNEFSDVRNA